MAVGQPVLSIVIPTYNRAGTILRAVGSLTSADRDDISIVVVDDGSNDDTPRILSEIVDPRFTYLRLATKSNANVARNRGAAATSAPLLAFLDSDDEFLPGRVDRLISFFAENPSVDCVVDGFAAVHNGRRTIHKPAFRVATGDILTRALVAHALPITCSTLVFRRHAFEEVNGFDEALRRHQDRDLLLRAASRHEVILGTGEDVCKFQSADSLSRKPVGYIAGLDELVGRHPVFREPENDEILGYLIARTFLSSLLSGDIASCGGIMRSLYKADHLPRGLLRSLALYSRGKARRREVAHLLAFEA